MVHEYMVLILASTILSIILLYIILSEYSKYCVNNIQIKERVALIIAHPDDEVMFFAPTVLNIIKSNRELYIICMTNGNYENQGKIREKELLQSCMTLGIHRNNVVQLDEKSFPDNSSLRWDLSLLVEKLEETLVKYSIQTIITFGAYGVSGHCNHQDVHTAVTKLHKYDRFYLHDTTLIQKYSSIFNVLFTVVVKEVLLPADSKQVLLITDIYELCKIYSAMKCHNSQFVWFRKLYILFSLYVWMNELYHQPVMVA